MAAQAAWHTLPVSHPDLPALLVSVSFAKASYTIHLTDLANIWTEDLSKKELIKRALLEDIPIDVHEDAEQMAVFLAKLRSALEPSHPEHTLSSLVLKASQRDDDILVLQITCTLPAGMKPLEWPMNLKKAAPSALTTHLMLPIIQAQHVKAAESAKLIAALKEKDTLITRLIDKLEANGVGLELVFNQLSSKRKVTRAAAQDRVKGLAPFSEADFYQKAKTSSGADDVLGNSKELIEEVFGKGEGLSYTLDFESSHEAGLDGWWKKLGQIGAVSLAERKKEKTPRPATPQPRDVKPKKDDSGEVDDFEVQDTPPHQRSTGKKRTTATKDDEETASEAEEIPDSYPEPVASKAAPKSTPAKKGKLGAIGGKKKQAPPTAKSATPEPVRDEPMGDGDSTASEADEPPPPKPAATPKRRLGALGGKKKSEGEASQSKTEGEDEGTVGKKPAVKAKLGHIGKKAATPSAGEGASDKQAEAEKSKAKSKETKPPEETEEERADRRRVELEKELAKKAAAGPAKKKRKF